MSNELLFLSQIYFEFDIKFSSNLNVACFVMYSLFMVHNWSCCKFRILWIILFEFHTCL
ncbi:hypothetical protein [Plasmodium yoelii yoelii]|uniref:Uncharacterized protein n=1 Tax=Plasmodium yoelii yoelii TaxID=73239 RepID=Q7RMV1_PLAYO|nr:hypothetical protein [Plasmodium yoelii yoelii]